jgi:isoquinoline 1-oxidoreductase beta subunit
MRRLSILDKAPRAKAVLELAAEKAGWGQPLPDRVGRGVSVQFAFATYMAQVAEVEVSKDGAVRVRRVVCAVDCGTVINPDTVRAQIQSAIIFGVTAALYGEITLKDGRVEQANFDTYRILRMNEAPAIEVHIINSFEPPASMGFRTRQDRFADARKMVAPAFIPALHSPVSELISVGA